MNLHGFIQHVSTQSNYARRRESIECTQTQKCCCTSLVTVPSIFAYYSFSLHFPLAHYAVFYCNTIFHFPFFFLMIRRPPRSTLFPYPSLFLFFLKNTRPTTIHPFPPHAVFRF